METVAAGFSLSLQINVSLFQHNNKTREKHNPVKTHLYLDLRFAFAIFLLFVVEGLL